MKNILKLIIIAMLVLPTINVLAQTPPPMPPKSKTVNLTVLLEGFYSTTNGNMSKAQGVSGNKFQGTIADTITVELHDATTYATVIYTAYSVSLNQDGSATFRVPKAYNSSYYVTIKHRSSVETTTAIPVSFVDAIINYNFTTAASQAYGSNSLKELTTGVYGIYLGDLNEDGYVDIDDRALLLFDLAMSKTGYSSTDINGDGYVDIDDRALLLFNMTKSLQSQLP
ncbi:MAG: hypothetical protein GY756_11355 [bacterium]|nr:hypothetical protein [bacterium]